MNAIDKIRPGPEAATVVHGIMAYDSLTDELVVELGIPLFLDTLALKIAQVPAEDVLGALSYPLNSRQVETFKFLLGLDVDLSSHEYFLEAMPGPSEVFSRRKLEAVAVFSAGSRAQGSRTLRISESELVVPTLRLLEVSDKGSLSTGELVRQLTELLAPSGIDAKILEGRHDTYFSQKVRNLISHRDQSGSFINQGLVRYDEKAHSLTITALGGSLVQALRA